MPTFYVYHIERRLINARPPKNGKPGEPAYTQPIFQHLLNAWRAPVTIESSDSTSALAAAKRAFPWLGHSIAVEATDPEVTRRELAGAEYVPPI